ncbi:hypothetical protein UR09_06510 [Candidatus Nitromaritima sp. SCGC AAA799-A02]|nr:hypothetical protein UR09_06510 [Candidatus Nitromaritima sp. SCGC AAA799-A02]
MLEFLLITYIVLLFVFPLPALAILLGLATAWSLHRKYQLTQTQPPAGVGVLRLNAFFFSLNLIASLAMGLALAAMVAHKRYRRAILKLKPSLESIPHEKIFVTLTGLKKGSGFGPGLAPAYVDAGYLFTKSSQTIFEGVFSRAVFAPSTLARVEKKSSDKIQIIRGQPDSSLAADACLIALKDRFYPFKGRSERDRIVHHLSPGQTPKVELAEEYL